jgi:prepilin peptidase CpaA
MLTLPTIFQITVLGFAGLAVASAISDVRNLTIPNRYSLAITLLFPAYVLTSASPVDWVGALAIGLGLLALGFLLFAAKTLGGGDAKLIAAVSLWAGPDLFLPFLLITAIVGGTMALALWLRHRFSRAATPGLIFLTDVDPNFAKQPMPYAVAISAGALYVAFTLLGVV